MAYWKRSAWLLPALVAGAALAQPSLTPQAALSRIATANKLDAAWFVPAFASALPQVQGGFQGFVSEYGAFQGVDPLGNDLYRLRYAHGTVTVALQLSAAGLVSSLFLKSQEASAAASPAAPAPDEAQALTRLFQASTLQPAWFDDAFLQQVPASQLSTVLAGLRQGLGNFQKVQLENGRYQVLFTEGRLPINAVKVDAQGRFTALLIGAPVMTAVLSLNEALTAFKSLPGQVSVVVVDNGKLSASLNPAAKLAVGSAFKLGILSELLAQMKSGQHQWSEVTTLQAADKALPSGFLQTWPDNSPLTLQSLATLMISQSDNTATNVLLRLVGRSGVEKRLGIGVVLSTRDLFALKNPANKALLDAYLKGDDAQKRAVLVQAAAAPLPEVSLFAADAVVTPQVEWFVSTQTLCSLMSEVAALPLMQVNPGVADPQDFKAVSFKGGSEGGVLNFTTQVTTQAGHQICVSATVNDSKSVDLQKVALTYSRLLQAVR